MLWLVCLLRSCRWRLASYPRFSTLSTFLLNGRGHTAQAPSRTFACPSRLGIDMGQFVFKALDKGVIYFHYYPSTTH